MIYLLVVNDLPIITSIETILNELNLELKLNNKNSLQLTKTINRYKQLHCPFHKDNKPSAGVSLEHGYFTCFSCGRKYSLPRLISILLYDTDFSLNGERWIIKNFADYELENREKVLLTPTRIMDTKVNTNPISDNELNKYAYYHPYILNKRGISKNIVDLFDIGYDSSFKLKKDGNEIPCITFPVKDINGNCLFIARRAINTKLFNYPTDSEKPLYSIYELSITNSFNDKLYVTESIINCLTLWSIGLKAVALNGTGNEHQYELLKNIPNRQLVLALDTGDKAGRIGVNKLYKALNKDKILSWLIMPNKIDINDLYLKDKKNFLKNIKNIEKRY